MDIKKMIETIEKKGIAAESFVPELHHKLVKSPLLNKKLCNKLGLKKVVH
ncbi:hypothetical protein QUF88_11615 [Bacillus sp. DX1.1]|nr:MULTISPECIES: hypothetical protein [unclassified Bacillus (in: firmicutes)]MDM5154458.1 hypothetical protein [Bacillus sp. DX1.1]WJE83361.1 hypothetical protein QRE67_09120 [Bacillus sp. DX3.1]